MIHDCVLVFPSRTDVYSLKKPQNNIKILIHGAVVEVALICFAYTPVLVPQLVRDQHMFPGKMASAKQHNHSYHLPVMSAQKAWVALEVPEFVVLVREEEVAGKSGKVTNVIYKSATVYQWKPKVTVVHGHPDDWDFTIVGALTGTKDGDIYLVDETVTIRVDDKPYTGDPFAISVDGHYVGNDGYKVPKNFAEFYETQPLYVRRWSSKWLKKPEDTDEVRDWEQDLLLYLHYLPENSKARLPTDRHPQGCKDVIQCFDPYRQYGASERRFRNYLNICLHNRSLTIVGRQQKNPVYRRDNIIFGGADGADEDVFMADDEYIHSHSKDLEKKAEEQSGNVEKRLMVKHFMLYVLDHQPELYDTLLAISETGTLREAMETLEVDEATFTRDRKRIAQLKDAFMDGGPIQKQRKPYKKRLKIEGALLDQQTA